jgi:membrane-associated protease RseP (regulator of RpoE activity)
MEPVARRDLARSAGMFVLTWGSAAAAWYTGFGESIPEAMIFASALMGILLAHELGHWFVARYHGFELSLPLFIPFPSLFGTLGAVIQLRSEPKSRQALLEMGAAGPLAGMAVSLPVLALGLLDIRPPPTLQSGALISVFNDPLVVRLLGTLLNGAPPDRYASYGPAAWAGWVGCFLTGMNLVPIGQLDGGHVLNGVVPRLARPVSFVVMGLMTLAGVGWTGWLIWILVLLFTRASVPLPGVPETPALPLRSKIIAAVVLLVFFLTFIPTPIVFETVGAG